MPDEAKFLKTMDSDFIIKFKHFSIHDGRECIVLEHAKCKS